MYQSLRKMKTDLPNNTTNTTNSTLNKTSSPNDTKNQLTIKKCNTNHKPTTRGLEVLKAKSRGKNSNTKNNSNIGINSLFQNQTFTSESVKSKPKMKVQLKICNSFVENNHNYNNISKRKEMIKMISPLSKQERRLSYETNNEFDDKKTKTVDIKYNTKTHVPSRKINLLSANKERLINIYKYLAKNEMIKEFDEPNNNNNNKKQKRNMNEKDDFNLTAENLNRTKTTKHGLSKRNEIKFLPFNSLKNKKPMSEKKPLYPIKAIQIAKRPATVAKTNNKHQSDNNNKNDDYDNNVFHKKNCLTGNTFNKISSSKLAHIARIDTESSLSTESSVFLGRIEDYVIGKELGKGAYAVVKQAFHKPTNRRMAIKIYEKSSFVDIQKKRTVKKEIEIMKSLNHENIVKLFEILETSRQVSIYQ